MSTALPPSSGLNCAGTAVQILKPSHTGTNAGPKIGRESHRVTRMGTHITSDINHNELG